MTPTQQLLHQQAEGAMNRGDTAAAMRYRRLLSASMTAERESTFDEIVRTLAPKPEPKGVNLLQRILGGRR